MNKLPDRSLALSYEDVVADPKGTLEKIAAFCDLPRPSVDPPELGDDRGCAKPYLKFLQANQR